MKNIDAEYMCFFPPAIAEAMQTTAMRGQLPLESTAVEFEGTPIGEMTEEEILAELKKTTPNSVTEDFILTYMKLIGMDQNYPEYFL